MITIRKAAETFHLISEADEKIYVDVVLTYGTKDRGMVSWEILPKNGSRFLFKDGDMATWYQVSDLIEKAARLIDDKKAEISAERNKNA